METTADRVAIVREWMRAQGVAAVVFLSADPHLSEYPPEHHQVRAWISGFTGSAGTAVVTADAAGLWTDSRYFLAAETALRRTEFDVHRLHTPNVTDWPEWVAEHVPAGAAIAVDFRTITETGFHTLREHAKKHGVALHDLGDDVDVLWRDRPPLPTEPVWILDDAIAGEGTREKMARIRREIAGSGAQSHVVSALDDIAWILNLRGSDVPYNPVFLAYLVLSGETATLFTEGARLNEATRAYLEQAGVGVAPYETFTDALKSLDGPVLIDPDRSSAAIARGCTHAGTREAMQPSTAMKARKNPTELGHLRETMRNDGRAMVRFLRAFEQQVAAGEQLDEVSAAAALRRARGEIDDYVSDSFNYISGFNGNGAIVHYAADEQSAAPIAAPGVYLIDSGGQYLHGTTDITRTLAVGEPPAAAREDFTLVLKAHIALATLRFPRGTSGRDVDPVARAPLWRAGRSYGHGTGHGVGFFLNVHEGPQRIAPAAPDWPLETGMIVSNEPGLYRTGQWGIRIENLMSVGEATETDFGAFLRFETLSLCPIDLRMVDATLLTPEETAWLNEYHARVRAELSPGLSAADRSWLEHATRAIGTDAERR